MNLVPATFNKFVLASAALLVVVIAQSVEGQGPGPRVTVVNTETDPVPVTGSVQVTNQPSQPQASPFQASGNCVKAENDLAQSCDVTPSPMASTWSSGYVSIGLNNVTSSADGAEYRTSLMTTLDGSRFAIASSHTRSATR